MGEMRTILKRVRAARNIRTVTRTMEMVATARFQKVQGRAVSGRPYSGRLADVVGSLVARGATAVLDHPLVVEREEIERDVLLILTGDRGLCGGYNASVLRVGLARRAQLMRAGYEVRLHVSGKRGIRYLRFRGVRAEQEHTEFGDDPPYEKVAALADRIMEAYLAGEIGGLEVAYTQFISAGAQRAVIAQVLPLSELARGVAPGPLAGAEAPYEFLPSSREILGRLLPATVRLRLYQCFLDAAVSEHMARMAAMRSATDNADEMIRDLTVRYNRQRQAQITNELAEIMRGKAGLE